MTKCNLNSLVDYLLPSDCVAVVARGPIEGALEALTPTESSATQSFSPPRAQEFAEGRWCARTALAMLAEKRRRVASASEGIGRRDDGELGVHGAPVWSAGVVGAISHSASWRIAAVAAAQDVRGLGLDIEMCQPFSAEVAKTVLSPAERAGTSEIEQLVKFSAKESLYKVWAPIMHCWLGFEDAEVTLNRCATPKTLRQAGTVQTGCIGFRLAPDKSRDLIRTCGIRDLSGMCGRYLITEDFVLTTAWIEL